MRTSKEPTRASVIEANIAKQAVPNYNLTEILEMLQNDTLPPSLRIKTQHSVYAEPWLWEAFGIASRNLGKTNQSMYWEYMVTVVSDHATEIPQLQMQIQDLKAQEESLKTMIDAKTAILNNLLKQQENEVKEVSQKILAVDQTIVEVVDLLILFGSSKRFQADNYKRWSELSGKKVADIKSFFKSHSYRPSEAEITSFFKE